MNEKIVDTFDEYKLFSKNMIFPCQCKSDQKIFSIDKIM